MVIIDLFLIIFQEITLLNKFVTCFEVIKITIDNLNRHIYAYGRLKNIMILKIISKLHLRIFEIYYRLKFIALDEAHTT